MNINYGIDWSRCIVQTRIYNLKTMPRGRKLVYSWIRAAHLTSKGASINLLGWIGLNVALVNEDRLTISRVRK